MDSPTPDPLVHFLTLREAANELELDESSIRRMISGEQIEAQFADEEQIALLLKQKRIKGVPGTGVRLLHRDTVARAKQRPKRGRQPKS